MSTAARIEELRKKFDENPRRYFAPLANELRKAGELTQAIALCREHLPKQPGHMSGYIVFGQALYEVGELNEARTVFEQALALDPENLIALHHLGHIARQLGDTPAARRWYERALETDPRNDDIAHQLATLATPVRPLVAIPTPVSPAAVDPDRELDFLEAGIIAPRRDLGAIPTPPLAQEAIGAIPLAPTPDAAMRAVDFDLVNASLAQPSEEVAEQVAASAHAPIDLELDESLETEVAPSATIEPSAEAFAEIAEPSGQALPDDPFVFADDEFAAASLTDTGAAAPADLDAAFEEGLVTAGWPDPTELAAVATPRAVTPLSVEVTPDAVDAFGREAGDPVDAPLPEPEVEVLGDEADLVPLTPAAPVSALEELEDVSADVESEAELPWLAAAVTSSQDVSAIMHALEEDARALGEPDDVSVFAVPTPPAEEAQLDVASIDEASFGDVRFDDDDAAVEKEPVAEAPVAEAPVAEAPLAEVPIAEEEVAATMEADVDADFGSAVSDGTEDVPAQSPAFVTETMGELLVAQGFTDRAVLVYEELVRRRPYDPVLSARLAELREQLETPPPVSAYSARERYAALAARRVVRRTPVRPYTPVASAVVTPVSTPVVTPIVTRAVTPLASPAIAAEDSLASLFGAEPKGQDDFAAQALAEAFAPLPLETAPAEGFATTFLGAPDVPRTPTPAYGAVRQPTPIVVPPVTPAAADAGQEFSFDRFFPDPAAQGGSPTSAATPSSSADAMPLDGEPTPGEDLAQFSAWLKGLGQA